MTTDPSCVDRETARVCAWCLGPIPPNARRDAITCSKSHRQARHRFMKAVGSGSSATPVAGGRPRRLAYADPPYPGKSSTYYGGHPDYAGEVDHTALIGWLSAECDAWALSTSAEALPAILALCPSGVRVGSWHRGFRPNVEAQGPLNAWEPVIYGGQVVASPGSPRRVARDASAISTRRVDSLVYQSHPRTTDPNRVIGAKPAVFCRWVFDLLAATPADELVDVFPGSGGVSRAWEVYAGKPAIRGDRSW